MTCFRSSWCWCAAAVCIVVGGMARGAEAPPQAGGLWEAYARLSSAYDAAMPGWRPARPETGSLLFVAPDVYTGAENTAAQTARERAMRDEYAAQLFALAERAAAAGELSLAFEWATETVRENPDHDAARRVLGYERHNGAWLTPFARRMVEAGRRWEPTAGWVAADDADKPRKPGRDGWQVRTDHFLVTSNASEQAAAELAGRLERLYQVWRQLFAGFCYSEREVQALFKGEQPARQRHRPFRVTYHRDKQDYVAALQRRQPRIAETLGIYFDDDRAAHFFDAPAADNAATLHHEAVHQLFQETRPAAKHVGDAENFWVIEGIATYFETLREHCTPAAGLYFTIGESSAGRLPAARRRLLDEGFYVPLDELVPLGKGELQRAAELAKLYSQTTGLAALLMDGDQGRYREALVKYLAAVYAGRDDAQTLSTTTGRSHAELDAEYRHFLERLP